MSIKQEMLDKKTWAVVGVSAKKGKWGNKIYNILKDNNYKVYGVSPNYDEIDVVNMVVSPKISLNTLEEAKDLGIEYIFFQPGTYNDEVIAKAEELGLKYLTGDCIYAILRNRS